jgi:Terminase RNaseH-like domain
MFHAGQLAILGRAKRFNTAACGRRFGKTAMGIAITAMGWPACQQGLFQGFDVGWFAPSYKYLDEAWRTAKTAYGRQGLIVRTDTQQHRMELATGGALDFWTLEDEDAGRGRRYGVVVVDEAGLSRRLSSVWQSAIRPTLTDFAGGGFFMGTPKGWNDFHALSRKADGDDSWTHHHAPTSANPFIPPEEIEAARHDLPERVFAQEYLAQFLEDGGGVFRRITAAVDTTLHIDPHLARAHEDGRAYIIGVDWGRHEDFTVITVLDAKERAVVAVDRFTQIDYAIQLARLQAVHRRFPKAPILAESNSMGGPLVEQLQRIQLPVRAFQTTAASKADAIEALALAFEQGTIRLPPVQWLIDELLAYDQERMPSGAMRYGAPRGGHDDGVMSLAIAWSGLSEASGAPAGVMVRGL